jgi:hypothetical protein
MDVSSEGLHTDKAQGQQPSTHERQLVGILIPFGQDWTVNTPAF